MRKFQTIILIGACLLLFSFGNKTRDDSMNLNFKQTILAVAEDINSSDLAEVKIGTQTWSTRNLNVSTFRNGDTIPEAKTDEEWQKAWKESKPAWCYYDNNPENGKKYGKLYNWYAVNDPRGLAPQGWHVPTDVEWTTLTDYLGGSEVAGKKMKNLSEWNDFGKKNGNGTNESGFAGSPGGYRFSSGEFDNVGNYSVWWSSSEFNLFFAWYRFLFYNNDTVLRFNDLKGIGHSVRCLRD